MTTTRLFQIAAWICLFAIIFATISPISFRPRDFLPVDVDRALAFFVMSALFVIAYPRYILACAVLLVIGAGAIELLQYLAPTRHAQAHDAMIKAIGAIAGILVGWVANRLRLRFLPQS
ncbi:VanZ family protein [Rhizobium sp. LjRoot30]|uniref:VanZ family protein n=1 Tax=Rhizobium sp. LjRoot30 TaxID=3342320 RepID=UPI003ECDD623